MFVKPIRRLVEQKGFTKPTEPQEKAIPTILDGKNVLLISPTATGKTETAFLPVLNMLLLTPERPHGIKILYVTPLRALNRDLLERLEWWCNNLDIHLAVRHGDTDTKERTRQARSPPDLLITTPETLQAILLGRLMRQHLRAVRWVVVDEVHEMADSKRGSQMALALERLRMITGREFQMIGLSATIGSPNRVAQFLVGNGREVEIVRVPVARLMKFEILFPQPTPEDSELASTLFTHPEVAARLRVIRGYIAAHKSVLLFTNTRAISEVLASRFKVWDIDFPVSIHHGSLAKPSRIAAERGLKDGALKGLVATSSLELGIDIGRIDLVIQYMSPRQVTRLIQRVGRSGHRIGHVAKGVIITMDSDDTLEAMVIARRALEEELEPVMIPPKPYDVLAHQIVGLLMRDRWQLQDICNFFGKAYPYSDLILGDVKNILLYLHQRIPRLAWVDFEDMVATRPRQTKAIYNYYFENLSMIPAEKKFLVVDDENDAAVGVLDEAFVAEYGKAGIKFIIRGSPWQILSVSDDQIYVRQVDDPSGAIPSWVGEEIPVPFKVAQEVGWIRGFLERNVRMGRDPGEVADELARKYPADKATVLRALHETVEQVEAGYPVPTSRCIVLEDCCDFVIIHTHFGSMLNRTMAQLIGNLLSERSGYSIVVQHDPYRIFVHSMGAADANQILALFEELKCLETIHLEETLKKATVRTGLFKRRIVHVARRFGGLEKWVDLSKVTLGNLLKSFDGTAIYEEALKEVFTRDLDLAKTVSVLASIKNGEIVVRQLENKGVATPIARVGLEKASMKTDLIPPERMRRIIIETTKARLLNEVQTVICTACWEYLDMVRMKALPDKPTCPRCGSLRLGLLKSDTRDAQALLDKGGEKLTKGEEKMRNHAFKTSKLVAEYGKPAAIALSGKRLSVSDVKGILEKTGEVSNHFFELVIDAERSALKKRFW